MQVLRSSSRLAVRSRGALMPKRLASTSNPPQPQGSTATTPQPTKRSSALVPLAVIGAVVGGIALYTNSKTGSPDRIAKAMAKTGTPAQRSGGLGKMDSENKPLLYGEPEKRTEPVDRKPPTTR